MLRLGLVLGACVLSSVLIYQLLDKSNYKIVYFSGRGRAEVSRLIFAQAGVEYEDKRVQGEEWTAIKPTTPTGMLPILEVDGKQLAGSGPIARFLAERFGLAGSNDVENAEIAGILDVLTDFTIRLGAWSSENDEERKAAMLKKLKEEDAPKYWGVLEGLAKKNPEGWVYGNTPTYADISIYYSFDYVIKAIPTFEESFPSIAKLRAAVGALPKIAEWIKNRPQTNF